MAYLIAVECFLRTIQQHTGNVFCQAYSGLDWHVFWEPYNRHTWHVFVNYSVDIPALFLFQNHTTATPGMFLPTIQRPYPSCFIFQPYNGHTWCADNNLRSAFEFRNLFGDSSSSVNTNRSCTANTSGKAFHLLSNLEEIERLIQTLNVTMNSLMG